MSTVIRLAEHLPLEQGLRQSYNTFKCCKIRLAEHLPLEQGLRLRRPIMLVALLDVLAEHLPLEQGLRHSGNLYWTTVLSSQSIFH